MLLAKANFSQELLVCIKGRSRCTLTFTGSSVIALPFLPFLSFLVVKELHILSASGSGSSFFSSTYSKN
jgi:hypothetical protein